MNPYRVAFALVKDRLRWDMRLESWRSRSRLRSLKDSHAGRKAVILCNGPSLLRSDLSLVDGVFTFGLNKINLLFERDAFRPSCVVAVNPHVVMQNQEFYNQTSLQLFLDRSALSWVKPRNNITYLHSSSEPRVVPDVSISLHQGFTVTCVAMQLALHLGFSSVALIGCDHNFATKGLPNAAVRAVGPDQSHFDPRYFSDGQSWQLPDLAASEYYYNLAAMLYAQLGRQLWNCTEGGALQVLPRCSLKAFVQGKE